MNKINFINGESPYLSAENLNFMQDNIENALHEIQVLTGTIAMPASGDSSTTGATTLDYPTGFTADNCIVISVMSKRADQNGYATTMSSEMLASSIRGNGDTRVTLQANNILVQSDKSDTSASGITRAFKIALMKIS